MTDIFESPKPFEGNTPPVADKPNGSEKPKRRKGRAKKVAAAPEAAPATPAPVKKRGRPAKADSRPQWRGPIPRPAVGLETTNLLMAAVGLDAAETQFVASVLAALQGNSKKSRTKIVGAIGKIFA